VKRIHGLSCRIKAVRGDLLLTRITYGPNLIESYRNRTLVKRPLTTISRYTTSTTMNSLESVSQSLAGLSIIPSASITHAETNSPASWREALLATSSAPKSFELIKTLVYKPKTAKTAIPVPVVVIAREETETSSSALGKKLNLKELRLASEDLLAEFFALDKNSCTLFLKTRCNLSDLQGRSVSLLSLTSETFPKVVTVIDASITSSSSPFALHALSSSATIFLSGQDILSYLRKLETEELKFQEIDFASLKSDVAAAPSKPAAKEKEVAKIDGAVQIAIGVKKEVDFSAWYQSVGCFIRLPRSKIYLCVLGLNKSRNA
jgi:prolyl-tRNA synthetase